MGNLLNQWMASKKIMGWHKKPRVFVRMPNGLYNEEYYDIKNNHLMVYTQEKDFIKNPKIQGLGAVNSSTYQKTYVWQFGEKYAWPLFERDTTPEVEDDDTLGLRLFNLGVLFKTKQMESKLGGLDSIPLQAQWLHVAMTAAMLVMGWQILGAMKGIKESISLINSTSDGVSVALGTPSLKNSGIGSVNFSDSNFSNTFISFSSYKNCPLIFTGFPFSSLNTTPCNWIE